MPKYKSLLFITLITLTSPVFSNETTNPIMDLNGIAAVVEDQVITYDDLYHLIRPVLPQIQAQSKDAADYKRRIDALQDEALQNLIDQILIVKEFERQGFQIPNSIIENEYDDYIQTQFGGDRSLFLNYLESQGKNVRQFRKEFKDRLIVSAMRGKKQQAQSEISPEKIEQYYESHLKQFQKDEQVHVRQILLTTKDGQSSESLLQEARSILQQLDSGASFIQLADSLAPDNDLGWISRTDMLPELSTAAFNLEADHYSQPILLNNTVFILYAQEKRAAGIQPLDAVREEVEVLVSAELARQNIEKWLEWLRKQAYIKYYIED